VNAFGMLFAEAVLDTDGMLEEMIAKQKDGKKFVIDELTNKGYKVVVGEGNFFFVKPHTDAEAVMKKMKDEKRILIKTYSGIADMGTCLRVSTGERSAMQRFLDGLEDCDK
jgi:histidinol-phosphate aminotransferase